MANEYNPATYGDAIADVYDEMYPAAKNVEPIVSALTELANGGNALELGVGTGRIALPLAERGVEIHGIEISEAMVEALRAKPGGKELSVTVGDFADVGVDGRFSLIFIVFNTFYGLLTQEDQVRCFRNVAEHLTDDGIFVIEAFVPDMTRFVRNQSVSATVDLDRVMLDVANLDPVSQRTTGQHLIFTYGNVRLYPVHLRYAWPSEFNLMAQLAGMRLRERWGDWDKSPFTASSGKHVSVYELAR